LLIDNKNRSDKSIFWLLIKDKSQVIFHIERNEESVDVKVIYEKSADFWDIVIVWLIDLKQIIAASTFNSDYVEVAWVFID
jgi:hypothetical protein